MFVGFQAVEFWHNWSAGSSLSSAIGLLLLGAVRSAVCTYGFKIYPDHAIAKQKIYHQCSINFYKFSKGFIWCFIKEIKKCLRRESNAGYRAGRITSDRGGILESFLVIKRNFALSLDSLGWLAGSLDWQWSTGIWKCSTRNQPRLWKSSWKKST